MCGVHGQAAPRHVDQGQESEPEDATTQLQLKGDKTVRDQVVSQESVTQTLVQQPLPLLQQQPQLRLRQLNQQQHKPQVRYCLHQNFAFIN